MIVDDDFFRMNGFDVQNARIVSVDLSMADHGCLTFEMTLEGNGWCVTYGNRVLGKGHVDADEFEGGAQGIEYIMRIMDVVGVDYFNDMKGKYVRVVTKGWGDTTNVIGNIIQNKWFDQQAFFQGGTENE